MQDGGYSTIDSSEAAIDCSGEFIRFADEFSVRAERTADIKLRCSPCRPERSCD